MRPMNKIVCRGKKTAVNPFIVKSAGSGNRTRTNLRSQDFKSCASACSATPASQGAGDGIRTRDLFLGKEAFYC